MKTNMNRNLLLLMSTLVVGCGKPEQNQNHITALRVSQSPTGASDQEVIIDLEIVALDSDLPPPVKACSISANLGQFCGRAPLAHCG